MEIGVSLRGRVMYAEESQAALSRCTLLGLGILANYLVEFYLHIVNVECVSGDRSGFHFYWVRPCNRRSQWGKLHSSSAKLPRIPSRLTFFTPDDQSPTPTDTKGDLANLHLGVAIYAHFVE